MVLKDILAISKQPGLYKLIASRSNGLIVTQLGDSKKKFVSSRQHLFTPIENITIYCQTDTKELSSVLETMKNKEKELQIPNEKTTDKELRIYFNQILPDHDPDKVYLSDIKKIIKWYKVLDEQNLLVSNKKFKKEVKK